MQSFASHMPVSTSQREGESLCTLTRLPSLVPTIAKWLSKERGRESLQRWCPKLGQSSDAGLLDKERERAFAIQTRVVSLKLHISLRHLPKRGREPLQPNRTYMCIIRKSREWFSKERERALVPD